MTAKDILLKTLFETAGREHINIKFFRARSESITEDALCGQANHAIFQVDNGLVEGSEVMAEDFRQLDVRNMMIAG